MKKLWRWGLKNRKTLLSGLVAGAIVTFLLLYRLGSLTGHLATTEQFLPTFHASLRDLWYDPLNLPLILSRLLVAGGLPYGGVAASRLPSVLLGLLSVALFYWLVRRWYGWRIAFFGSVMLTVSPWFLHAARLATPEIVYPFMLTGLLALYALYHHPPRRLRYYALLTVGLALAVYTPGMIWLVAAMIILEFKNFRLSLKQGSKKQRLLVALLPLISLIPLAHAVYAQHSLYKTVLGLPVSWPTPLIILKNIGRLPLHIFVRGPLDPTLNVGRLPLINSFSVAMFLIGLYLYASYWKSSRTRLLLTLAVLGVMLIALQGPVTISLLLPITFIVASGGVGYILHRWLKVFPRNPIARSFGIGLVALTLLFSASYDLRQYFIAWPHSPTTRAAFEQRQ